MFLEFENGVRAHKAHAESLELINEAAQKQSQAYEAEQRLALDALLANIYAKQQAEFN